MTTIPTCATRCGLVQVLLGELARARGVTVDVVRVGHGLDHQRAATTPQACEPTSQPQTLVPHHDTAEESPA